jgi:uncharacterized protein DUF3551
MRTIHAAAIVIAFSAFVFVMTAGSAAQAGPIVPPGHYCIAYDEGGSDCSFTSFTQCEATASGIGAECYGNTVRDGEGIQFRARRNYESRAQSRR